MVLHESSVNFANLIRDLAEMYAIEVPEVVLVELVANSLDARATTIAIDYAPAENTLVVEDNGKGMTASQFDEYHDFAAGLKTKGEGIGFAGVGAKISFNIADRVLTETGSESFSGGSNWYLKSKRKLIWQETEPVKLRGQGTRVEVHFRPSVKPIYRSTEGMIRLLRRHYLPLFDSNFLDLYDRLDLYSSQFRFVLNGQEVGPSQVQTDYSLRDTKELLLESKGKPIGYGILGVADSEYPVAPYVAGVLVCTYGKVIRTELFNQFPGSLGPRLFGMVEIPGLVEFLTTSKTDFTRRGKHRKFERLYDPVRQQFKAWLSEIGAQTTEAVATNEATKLERELKKLVDELPELSEFFGFRSRKTVLQPSGDGEVNAEAQMAQK